MQQNFPLKLWYSFKKNRVHLKANFVKKEKEKTFTTIIIPYYGRIIDVGFLEVSWPLKKLWHKVRYSWMHLYCEKQQHATEPQC